MVTCQISGKNINEDAATPISLIRPGVLDIIKKEKKKLPEQGYISKEALKKYRKLYMEQVLAKEKGQLSKLDREVITSMVEHDPLVKDVEEEIQEKLTIGQKLADKIAEFGGSWTFIIIFFLILLAWILVNSIVLLTGSFDPFPYILLNLVLSCLAAIQAPIIMMSQNRKEEKDRLRSENDYKVNLKAELEIRHLHEKMDNLVQKQWQRLIEIQKIQMDLLDERNYELRKRNRKNKIISRK